MAQFQANEIGVGHVIHADPAVLKRLGTSQTNALLSPVDYSVQTPHYFLVIEIDTDGYASCFPLFSNYAKGRELLSEPLKGGHAEHWIDQASYLFRWQQWRVPLDALAMASAADTSPSTNRRTYAVSMPGVIGRLRGLRDANRNPWRTAELRPLE